MKEQRVIYVPVNDFDAPLTAAVPHRRIKSIKRRAKNETRARYAFRWVLWKVYNALVALEGVKNLVMERKASILNVLAHVLYVMWVLVKYGAIVGACTAIFYSLGVFEHGVTANRLPTALLQAGMLLVVVIAGKTVVCDWFQDWKDLWKNGAYCERDWDD